MEIVRWTDGAETSWKVFRSKGEWSQVHHEKWKYLSQSWSCPYLEHDGWFHEGSRASVVLGWVERPASWLLLLLLLSEAIKLWLQVCLALSAAVAMVFSSSDTAVGTHTYHIVSFIILVNISVSKCHCPESFAGTQPYPLTSQWGENWAPGTTCIMSWPWVKWTSKKPLIKTTKKKIPEVGFDPYSSHLAPVSVDQSAKGGQSNKSAQVAGLQVTIVAA